jgi:predicted ester cyclase
MSGTENKLLLRQLLEEVVNTGNVALVEKYVSPEYIEVYGGKRHSIGIEGMKAHILGVRQTYPDLHVTVEAQISEGEWVATCIKATGTHKGEWLGIKPTGKRVEFTGVNIDRVVKGRLIEHSGAANMLEPLLDIGAIRIVGMDEPTEQ